MDKLDRPLVWAFLVLFLVSGSLLATVALLYMFRYHWGVTLFLLAYAGTLLTGAWAMGRRLRVYP